MFLQREQAALSVPVKDEEAYMGRGMAGHGLDAAQGGVNGGGYFVWAEVEAAVDYEAILNYEVCGGLV